MSTESRLNHAFRNAIELPLNGCSKYVLISDCHRGCGTSSDNFLKNQHLFFAALKYYYQNQFTYIELGDGDELWENKSYENIIETHNNVFWMLKKFYNENRLHMIYGNHDIQKRKQNYVKKYCDTYFCNETQQLQPLFSELTFPEAIRLQSMDNPENTLYLTHGHQASVLNSCLWFLARFLVRYLWQPLENFGVLDPTSAAKNNRIKTRTEKRLNRWATKHQHLLITGHTHRPVLTYSSPYYCNTGSCVHPRCITCIEIEHCTLTLVKWCTSARNDGTLYVAREVLSEPLSLQQRIHNQHRHKANQKGIGRRSLVSMAVSFWNHFITDNIKHRSSCKCQCKGQNTF